MGSQRRGVASLDAWRDRVRSALSQLAAAGAVAALAGVLGALLVVEYGVPVPLAIVGGAVTGAIAGMVNGVLVTQAGMAPFIATLGMLSVARGLVYIVTGSVAVSGAPPEFKLLGQGRLGALPIPVLALVIVALAGHFILTRAKLGRYAYAMGSNAEAARLSGIPVKRYLSIV